MIPDGDGLGIDFSHPHYIMVWVEAVEGRTGEIELIPEYDNKIHTHRDAMTAATA